MTRLASHSMFELGVKRTETHTHTGQGQSVEDVTRRFVNKINMTK